ncbi:MAG: hypothetical protein GY738_17905 [Pseudoalteromonas sp.]|nr:hypothetical protein [Pseudoalteromonas sp.]
MKKEDYSEKEAILKAFKDRKFLLKKVMATREHILQEVLDEDDTDETGSDNGTDDNEGAPIV